MAYCYLLTGVTIPADIAQNSHVQALLIHFRDAQLEEKIRLQEEQRNLREVRGDLKIAQERLFNSMAQHINTIREHMGSTRVLNKKIEELQAELYTRPAFSINASRVQSLAPSDSISQMVARSETSVHSTRSVCSSQHTSHLPPEAVVKVIDQLELVPPATLLRRPQPNDAQQAGFPYTGTTKRPRFDSIDTMVTATKRSRSTGTEDIPSMDGSLSPELINDILASSHVPSQDEIRTIANQRKGNKGVPAPRP